MCITQRPIDRRPVRDLSSTSSAGVNHETQVEVAIGCCCIFKSGSDRPSLTSDWKHVCMQYSSRGCFCCCMRAKSSEVQFVVKICGQVFTTNLASADFARMQRQTRALLLCCMHTCFQPLMNIGLSAFLKDEQLLKMQQCLYCYSNFSFMVNTCPWATGEWSDRPSANLLMIRASETHTHTLTRSLFLTHTHTHVHTRKRRQMDQGTLTKDDLGLVTS